jgi:hypothetical protein
MYNICYAIIHCKEVSLNVYDDLVKFGVSKEDIIEYSINNETLSKIKNNTIKYAKNKNYDFLFIIEDDIIIKDGSIFDKYISVMMEYKVGVVFYPYYSSFNRVLGNIPNPAVKVKFNENDYQQLARIPVDAFIGLNLKTNNILFDENYQMMEFNEYLKRCNDENIVPMNGFYFDVNNSWEYFSDNVSRKINATKQSMINDKKLINDENTLVFDNNINKIYEYITSLGERNAIK